MSSTSTSTSTPTSTPTRKGEISSPGSGSGSGPTGGENKKGFLNKVFRRTNNNNKSPSSTGSNSPFKKSKNKSNKKVVTSPSASASATTATPTKKNKNKMKTKKKSKEGSSSSGGSSSATTNNGRMVPDDEPILLTRRVIKATRPPSPISAPTAHMNMNMASMTTSSDQGTVDTSLSSSVDDRERPQILGRDGKDENLREKTEKFRLDRLENAAAIRKENKEKEVMQHRLGVAKSVVTLSEEGSGSGSDDVANNGDGNGNGNGADVAVAEMEVSDIFKTQTFHPEHKRKVSSDDHANVETEKKTKLDLDDTTDHGNDDTNAADLATTISEEDDGKDTPKAIAPKRWQLALSGWITAVAPATVVAACAFMMMRVMRKR